MTKTERNKFKSKRTISTRSFKANTDLLNKLINTSEVPHSTVSSPLNMSTSNSSATAEAVIGYGSTASDKKLHFQGVRDEFKSWQTRMKLRFRKLKLADVLEAEEPDSEKNLEIYMQIVEHIDDKSLRLIQDVAEDNGKLAWKILSDTYLGNDEDRVFKVLTDFSNLSHKRN